jgi:hypothetical protein
LSRDQERQKQRDKRKGRPNNRAKSERKDSGHYKKHRTELDNRREGYSKREYKLLKGNSTGV